MDKFKIHFLSFHENTLQYNCSICDCDLKSTQELFDDISLAHEGKKQPNAISIKLSENQISSGLEIVFEKKNLGISQLNYSSEASISKITTSDTLLKPQNHSFENRSKLKSILLSSKSLKNNINNYNEDQITASNEDKLSKDSEKKEHIIITEIVSQGEGSNDFPQWPMFSKSVENCVDQTNVDKVQNEPDQIVYKCSLCQRTFTSMDNYKIHIISVHENTLHYNCSICDCDMKSTQDLFDHISFVHEGKKQPNAILIKLSQNQINAGLEIVYEKKNNGKIELNSSFEASISRITTSDTLLKPPKNSFEKRSKLKSILLSQNHT